GYEYYMRCRGLTPNTTSFYMRVLRAVYNRAVDAGAVDPVNPFRHVYTGVDKTRKRALRIDDIRRIMRLDLGSLPSLDYARDIFMLSFYMRGMSLIDMAYLRKSDLCDGYVVYRRRKTGQKLYVAWTQELQYMVDKYSDDNSPYLFPIFRRKVSNPYSSYRNVSYRINYSLRKIAKMINYGSPLTLYCARHSWASIAQAKNIPLSVISAGMGHNSEMTTRIYLASLDNTLIDRANSIILKAIR
ncbi:MAG: site-specific integrase, partial [Duncaniella sp.]|nr:site-specific integrase [Duncaniella sp.]